MIQNAKETAVTGTQINYHEICHTKLWFFAHHIQMEQDSDLVALGKLTHEEHYTRDTSKENFSSPASNSTGLHRMG